MHHLSTTWTYYEKQYSPFRFPPTFRKHAAPRFRYAGSWAKGIPFKLERNGRSRKMKRACMVQQQRFSVSKRKTNQMIHKPKWYKNHQKFPKNQVIVLAFLFSVLTRNLQLSKKVNLYYLTWKPEPKELTTNISGRFPYVNKKITKL